MDAPHAWLAARPGRVSGKSGLAEAIRYASRHWTGLVLFLDDGRLEPNTDTIVVRERVARTDRIRGLLAAQGIFDLRPPRADRRERLDTPTTGDGRIAGRAVEDRAATRA